ncbi:MAG TPA: NAD(P)-dependent oxidoreductase [Bryobacteraceae bacterium]|nr:NAD(P)-dependent oxidoreductase [Bryobacteraceae bacterium]
MLETTLNKETTRIGFIGLGLMGSRLARRLHSAGWVMRGFERIPERARAVSEHGIPIARSIRALTSDSDVIVSSVANDAAVKSVYLGKAGVLSAAKPGTTILELSTISADLSREIHNEASSKGVNLLDVAISGSTSAVEAGTITLLAGGDRNTFERCTPIFETIAGQWFLIGPAGSGVEMKLVVNLLLGVGMEAIAEAVSLGRHLGIEENVLLSVLSETAVIPPAFAGKFEKIKNRDYAPEFPLRLMYKDLNLIMDAASSSGAKLPAASAARRVFASYAQTSGDLDLSAITDQAPSETDQAQTTDTPLAS